MKRCVTLWRTVWPTGTQYAKWALPTKWGFWAAVIGIPLAFVGLGLGIWPILQPDPSLASRKDLIYKVALELRNNRLVLTRMATVVRLPGDGAAPRGKIQAQALLELIEKHTELVFEGAYGEEKHIRDLAVKLNEMGEELASAKVVGELKTVQSNGEWTLDDVLFLNDFLNWYLAELIRKELDPKRLYSLTVGQLQGDTFRIEGVSAPNLRLFTAEGKPIQEFVDFLGLID